MSIAEIFILAVGLSMDAFAVSICKGTSIGRARLSDALISGLWFGSFQALMPLIGYFLGVQLAQYIQVIDHWIACILLAFIGINMAREGFKGEGECDPSLKAKDMLILAIATSIDALASGVALAAARADILYAVIFIGLTTFALSCIGVKAGSKLGSSFGSKAQIAGGAALCLIGLKIVIEHISEGI